MVFNTTVCNEKPVEVHFQIGQPEYDVGIYTPYLEDIWLEVKGKRAKWLENRLSKNEWILLENEAMELWYDSK